MRSAIARDLPVVSLCGPHEQVLSIVGGGPSLEDTYRELTGYIAAVNGSLAFLLGKGVVPNMCGVCDPSPHMVDIVEADPRVTYFLASIVHPTVYDKLLNAGCRVYRWNSSSVPGGEEVLDEIEPNALTIGGGSTMGLRWITLGYSIGFRSFHLHGMDSSFRKKSSHAYPDHQDAKDWIGFEGYQTRPNFIGQVADFIGWMDRLQDADVEPVSIKVYGDGLLQSKFKEWKARNPGWHEGGKKPERKLLTDGFVWPASDKWAKAACLTEVKHMDQFLGHVRRRGVAVQAGGNVGVYPVHLAKHFNTVHTFEPDPANYACLSENIKKSSGRIAAYHAALGERDGTCGVLNPDAANAGAVQVSDAGTIPMRMIDSIGLPGCDLIWLDIEGYELNALKGAEKTIARFRPTIIVEEKPDLPVVHGLARLGVREWLEERGYNRTLTLNNDTLYLGPSKIVARRNVRLTIALVQVGNYLGRGAEYVAKIVDGIKANMPPHVALKFVCVTDDPESLPEGVEAKPVDPGIAGWWNKITLFRPGAFEPGEQVFYIDLDAIVTGDLGDFAAYDGDFAIMRDAFRSEHMQSACMSWRAGSLDHVWTRWDGAGRPQHHPHGDQAWIQMMQPEADYWQDMCPGQLVSFKADCMKQGRIPDDARIVMFHGKPRPHECEAEFIKQLWNRPLMAAR